MNIRESFILTDGKMRVLAELVVLAFAGNLVGLWQLLGDGVIRASVLPATAMLLIFWFLIWTIDLRVVREELQYYTDTIVILSGLIAAGGFIGVTAATGSYGTETTYCIVYEACIDHAFSVSSGLAALFVTVILFGVTMHYTPRVLFPQKYEAIRDTAFFAAWNAEEEDEELSEMQMMTIKETGLDDVSLDEVIEYGKLTRYHRFVLPLLILLAVVNGVIWEMIPHNLSAPFYLHLVTIVVIFIHIIYITGPRMYAAYAGNVVQRLRRVTTISAVIDGIMIGILLGAMLVHDDIPLTGSLPRNAKMLVTVVLAIPSAVVMPAILHYVFRKNE
jgi:hypothetical protein